LRLLCLFAAILLPVCAALAQDRTEGFEAANKLYEQGRFPEAAAAYEKLLQGTPPSETLYFNLGNAWFKAGQTGRAIAAYRRAEQLAPRDPSIRFNLQFARKKVAGGDAPTGTVWHRALTALTLNEWSVLAGCALWLWFGLLVLREIRPALKQALSGYTATAGAVFLMLAVCLGNAAQLRFKTRSAVVIVPDAIARSGPLDEAKVLHQFRDGVEVKVLDDKEVSGTGGKQTWLQVSEATGRSGWMKSDQLVEVAAERSNVSR